MPRFRLPCGSELHYEVDDFTDPWSRPDRVVFLHGLAECGRAWGTWIPTIGRHFGTIRLDQRGFGKSSPMPASFDWSIDVPVDDLARFLDALGLERVHLVSAKFGGTVGMRFAARHPDRVKSLSVVSSPVSLGRSLGAVIPQWQVTIAQEGGVLEWARSTMDGRLGSGASPDASAWWTAYMGSAPASTLIGIMRNLAEIDVTRDLPDIRCPTLIVTTRGSGLGSVEQVEAWQRTIPNSELAVVEDDSYHVAAARPDHCARIVLAFLARHAGHDGGPRPARGGSLEHQ